MLTTSYRTRRSKLAWGRRCRNSTSRIGRYKRNATRTGRRQQQKHRKYRCLRITPRQCPDSTSVDLERGYANSPRLFDGRGIYGRVPTGRYCNTYRTTGAWTVKRPYMLSADRGDYDCSWVWAGMLSGNSDWDCKTTHLMGS